MFAEGETCLRVDENSLRRRSKHTAGSSFCYRRGDGVWVCFSAYVVPVRAPCASRRRSSYVVCVRRAARAPRISAKRRDRPASSPTCASRRFPTGIRVFQPESRSPSETESSVFVDCEHCYHEHGSQIDRRQAAQVPPQRLSSKTSRIGKDRESPFVSTATKDHPLLAGDAANCISEPAVETQEYASTLHAIEQTPTQAPRQK